MHIMCCRGGILLGVICTVAKVASAHLTCCVDSLNRCSLEANRRILVVATLNLLIERERHPLTIVAVVANTSVRDPPPLPPTVRCQHVAGEMVPPMAKGSPIVQAMELANLRALLHELQSPTLLAILAQTDLVLVQVEGYVLSGSVLLCILLWNGVLLAVAA
jgi:hypothetical protein